MAYVHRLVFVLFLVFLGSAAASPNYYVSSGVGNCVGQNFPSISAASACAVSQWLAGSPGWSYSPTCVADTPANNSTHVTCTGTQVNGGTVRNNAVIGFNTTLTCIGAGAVPPVAGSCPPVTCTAPLVRSDDGQSCVPPTASSVCAGMNSTGQVYRSGSVLSTTTCAGGFVAKGEMAAAGDGVNNYIWGPFTCSGATCTAGTGNTPSAQPPSPCLRPQISGTVNGVSVCLSPPSKMATDSTKSAPAPAGAASGAASGLGGSAPAGATDSEKSTTCSGASCTTTTTFRDSGGSVISTQSETRPAPAFCVENPASPLCVQSSIRQTSCGSSDACTGDAVQCAIQARAKQTACAFDSSAAAASEENAYTTAKGRTGDQTQGNDVNTTVAITSGSFDQTELMGAAAGLSDLAVTVMGRTTVLEMSMLNQWFSVLGYLLVGVTGLLCMRIVSRG